MAKPIILLMKKAILCPICSKLIGKIEEEGKMEKAYLWCRRCKKEIYINNASEKSCV